MPENNLRIEGKIKKLLLSELNVSPAAVATSDASTPLLGRGIGLDSVETMALVVAMEEEFNISVPNSDLTVGLFDNIGTLVSYILGKITEGNGRGSVSED
jgi:acyl carrier protein